MAAIHTDRGEAKDHSMLTDARSLAVVMVLVGILSGCQRSRAPEAAQSFDGAAGSGGARAGADSRPATLELRVTARQYAWSFVYPNGMASEELHLPVAMPVSLRVGSKDVVHGLFIPDFRVRCDAVPGRESRVAFTTSARPGEFRLSCAEYCGPGHSTCGAKVVVHEAADYQAWLSRGRDAASSK